MARSKQERKAELLAKAERMIDELLGWEEGADKPTFVAIEEEVIKLRKQLDEAMIEDVLREQALAKEKERPNCKKCGGAMEHKGKQERSIGGWVGEVKVKRTYYYCPKCRAGFSPSGLSVRG